MPLCFFVSHAAWNGHDLNFAQSLDAGCSVIPEADNPVHAWQRAQRAIKTLPDSQDIFATTWSGGMLFCGPRAAAVSAGIRAYQAGAHTQQVPP